MRKEIRNRFYLYVLYAALAIMFWFFDLEILSWIFAALFILPLIIGGGILTYTSFKDDEKGADDEEYELTTQEKKEQEERLNTIKLGGEWIAYFEEMKKRKAKDERTYSFEEWQAKNSEVTE